VGGSGSQRPKKYQGQMYVLDYFYGVFKPPSPRNAQKHDKTKTNLSIKFLVVGFRQNWNQISLSGEALVDS
jgi:hypothetical protein